ncbi:helix-turn-helix domain-containing protein [Metasolibacillus sp. FSL H7-0170]|uniref:helix-turn-helix domain-containing protein n=1 Tax=Metasolibacillus sp. FSL H7-0170 TaxID=2921431 RepID=UPI00315830E4
MTFGEAYKLLRLSKGFTLKEAAKDIISVSFLSKFERNESEITVANLLALLERLNTSIEEFLAMNEYSMPFKELVSKIKNAFENNNIQMLTKLYNKEIENYNINNIPFHYYNAVMIKGLIMGIDSTKATLSKEEKNAINDYLFAVEYIGTYEIALFGNSYRSLEYPMIMSMTKEIARKVNLEQKSEYLQKEYIRILLNTAIAAFEHQQKNDFSEILMILKHSLNEVSFYFEKVKFLYLKGVYELKYGDKHKGRKLVNDSLNIMELLGDEKMKINHEIYLHEKLNFHL